MKKRHKLFIICLIIIIIAVSEIQLHKNYYPNIDSDSYLSSNDEKRNVDYCSENDNRSDINNNS